MRASFFEYHVAMSGIFTARANLNVVGHNMANAAIPGYSRQVTVQQASRPLTLYDGRGMYGTGSEVLGIKQIRDKYLDNKYWQHSNVLGEYQSKNTNLEMVETVFSDLNDSGVLSCFREYFDTLQDLSQNTPDNTYRSNVISAADTLTQLIRSNAEALQKHQRDINGEVENVVSMINSLGVQIADINEQISGYERDGSMANDLRDQRARLVDQLSELVNVTVEEEDYSNETFPYDLRYSVLINGQVLVQEGDVNPLMVVARETTKYALNGREIVGKPKQNEMDAPGLYDIYFSNNGMEFNVHSITLKGTLKGLIDVRDGNGGNPTEPEASEYITGKPGSYVNADTTADAGDGELVTDLLNAPADADSSFPGGPVTIINSILGDTGTPGDVGTLESLKQELANLDPSSPNYRNQLRDIAERLYDELALADYALKELTEMTKAVLPAATQTPPEDGTFEKFMNDNFISDGDPSTSSTYNQDLSKALDELISLMDSTKDTVTDVSMATRLSDVFNIQAEAVAATIETMRDKTVGSDTDDGVIETAVANAAANGEEVKVIAMSVGTLPTAEEMYSTTLYKGIPYYMNKLNTLVRTFARAMNEGLDFQLENIPKDTNGNIVGHMYGYDNSDPPENAMRLLFTSINGVNTGNNPSDFGGLSMWKVTYKVNGKDYSETLTSNNDIGPDIPSDFLPQGAELTSCERMYVWESTYTQDGKTVRNIEIAGADGPNVPADATSKIISDTTIDYSSLNAFNFTVNPDLLESGGSVLLAASSDPTLGESSNDVILGFGKIGEYNSLFREGKLLDFVIGTIDHLAIDRSQAIKFDENYTEIKLMTDNQRISVSGVDTNEEITNMIRYNQQFQACAQLVNVINQIYNTLINELGV